MYYGTSTCIYHSHVSIRGCSYSSLHIIWITTKNVANNCIQKTTEQCENVGQYYKEIKAKGPEIHRYSRKKMLKAIIECKDNATSNQEC